MICIFSITQDQTTTEVIRWLAHSGFTNVIRINSDDTDATLELSLDDNGLNFRHNDRLISLSDIKAVWYRKGRRWICSQFPTPSFAEHPELTDYLRKKLAEEELRLSEYFHFLIESRIPALGSPFKCTLNKLMVLYEARKVGLLTPSFHVSNSRTMIEQLQARQPLITKAIGDVLYLYDTEEAGIGYFSYTEVLTHSHLSELPERIAPSFIQQQISKQFEVRTFYLEGKCYSMAIFSQEDEQTRVDFRKYNSVKPNRTVPFLLPRSLESKVCDLFRELGLNTGSIDFIVDQSGQFFFLEINPVGQFTMVSRPCNYYLEREVARKLYELTQRS